MHLLVDISAHGLGHLAQTAPVLDALASRLPTMRLTVRSALTRQQLARRIGAPALRIFDCTTYLKPGPDGRYIAESGRSNYDKGHIPGAAFLDLQTDLSDKGSKLRFTLPPLEELTKAFAAKGVGHGTFVVLYSHASPV